MLLSFYQHLFIRFFEEKHRIYKSIIGKEINIEDVVTLRDYKTMLNTAKTKDELLDNAKRTAPIFEKTFMQLKKYGEISFGPGNNHLIKSSESVSDKIDRYKVHKYFPDDVIVSNIRDTIRCTLVIDGPRIISAIIKELMKLSEGPEKFEMGFDNKWKSSRSRPIKTGYVSLHVFLRFQVPDEPNKFVVGELQIQFLEIKKISEDQHKYYQNVRNIGSSKFETSSEQSSEQNSESNSEPSFELNSVPSPKKQKVSNDQILTKQKNHSETMKYINSLCTFLTAMTKVIDNNQIKIPNKTMTYLMFLEVYMTLLKSFGTTCNYKNCSPNKFLKILRLFSHFNKLLTIMKIRQTL